MRLLEMGYFDKKKFILQKMDLWFFFWKKVIKISKNSTQYIYEKTTKH